MSASLSGHLLDQYYALRQAQAPFGQPLTPSQLVMSGPMSYAPQMHGVFPLQQPLHDQNTSISSADVSSFYADMAESTAQNIATLQAKLNKKLGPEFISQRPGPGGGMKLTYAEGWKIINLANEVFGFNGWSSSIVNLNTDFIDCDEVTKRYSVGVSAVIRVTLRDGVYHEDIGYGMLENAKSKGAALDKCKKEAVTDGIKRALRNFGNLLGNCLYDKQYTQEIVKMKVPPPKFDKNMLHRRPEFQEGNSTCNATTSNAAGPSNGNATSKPPVPLVIPKAIGMNSYSGNSSYGTSNNNTGKPGNAIPAHVRPLATSTPLRNLALGDQKVGSISGSQKPQAYAAHASRPSHQALSTSSAHINNLPNQAPKQAEAAQQIKLKAHVLKELERTETYSFSSDDDDEFLAALEQAEGDAIYNDLVADMGRPIDESDGIGSAIDFDEGPTGGREYIVISPSTSDEEVTLVDGRHSDGSSVAPHVQHKNKHVIQPVVKPANSNPVVAVQPHHPAPPMRRGVMQPRENPPPKLSSDAASDDEIARQIAAMRQQRRAAAAGSTTPVSDENVLPKAAAQQVPRSSSMGGFNFPPGMDPGAAPLSSAVRQSLSVNVQAGMKRSADAMNSEWPVSYANAQARFVRQPFARLDDPDTGDAKRIRS